MLIESKLNEAKRKQDGDERYLPAMRRIETRCRPLSLLHTPEDGLRTR